MSTLALVVLSMPLLVRAQEAMQLVPVPPCRLIDTRSNGGPITGGTSRTFNLPQLAQTGGCASLASATSYSLNVTVVPMGRLGFITIWPTGQPEPGVSLMNSLDGRIKADAAIVGAGTGGAVDVFVNNTANVILDINGYFEPATNSALAFYPLAPCRVVDTRNANGDLGGPFLTGNQQRNFPILESTCVPPGITPLAYSFNVTAVPHPAGQRLGFLSVWPQGQTQPPVSTLNNLTGTIVANAALVPAGSAGGVSVFPNNNTDLLLDINGYFARPEAAGLALYTLAPCRAFDTRNGGGAFTGQMVFDIETSPCSVPASATAYVLNATALPQGRLGYLTLWPDGESQPEVSTLNAIDGAFTSNMAIVGTSNGSIDAFAGNGTTNLLLDLSGYMAPLAPLTIPPQTLPGGTTGVQYQVQLTATGGEPPYGWNVISGTLPAGLSLSALGLISGVPTAGGTSMFSVQVTDAFNNTAHADLSITITAGGLVITTTSLPSGTQNVAYSATLGAAGGVPPYTWTLASGTLPPGLNLNNGSGQITGTPTTTGVSNFTVQVTDSQQSTAQAPLQISVKPAVTNSVLNGHYAIVFSGYKNGNPLIMVAAFVADGAGHISSGFLDLNDGSGEPLSGFDVIPQTIGSSSTYSLTAGGLGTMTVVTNLATYQFRIAVSPGSCSLNSSSSTCGRIIQSDPSNPQMYGSGVLRVQDPHYFSVETFFPGNFTLRVTGTDRNGKRYAAAGALGTNMVTLVDIDCSTGHGGNGWGLDGCPLDFDDAGVSGSDPLKGSFAATIDGNTGRGHFVNLTFAQGAQGICTGGASVCRYAYYVIDQQEMVLISADPISQPANLVLWEAVRQAPPSGGWGAASLSGTSVVELNSVAPNAGSPLAEVTTGLLLANGAGVATLYADQNSGGTLDLQQPSQGSYAFSTSGQKTGRATLSGLGQFGTTTPVLYMISPNTAFVVGTDSQVTSGLLEPQSSAPFANGSVINAYAGGSSSPVLAAVTNSIASLFADGAGDVKATQYISGPTGPGGPNNLTLSYQVDSAGRAIVRQGANLFGILYVVSPQKVVLLPAGTAPALSIFDTDPAN